MGSHSLGVVPSIRPKFVQGAGSSFRLDAVNGEANKEGGRSHQHRLREREADGSSGEQAVRAQVADQPRDECSVQPIQLDPLLGEHLRDAGYAFWNLGHPFMQYKLDLGAQILPRADFLDRWNAAN